MTWPEAVFYSVLAIVGLPIVAMFVFVVGLLAAAAATAFLD
jgi:hypothetical protein